MEFQTKIKVPYKLLTPEQKKEICNGCGGKGSWVKPPLSVFYDTSCNHHDYGYWCGACEEDRLKDDTKLREMMRKDCARLPWYKQALYRPWCLFYYQAVRAKGDNYFYWGKEKRWPIPTEDQLKLIGD